jgi:hypothetical protein
MQRSIQLVRGADGQAVTALLSEITQRHIDDYQNSWQEMLQRYQQEDKFWSWEFKRRVFLSQENYEGYAIEVAGHTEGLMMIEPDLDDYMSSDEPELAYFEYPARS